MVPHSRWDKVQTPQDSLTCPHFTCLKSLISFHSLKSLNCLLQSWKFSFNWFYVFCSHFSVFTQAVQSFIQQIFVEYQLYTRRHDRPYSFPMGYFPLPHLWLVSSSSSFRRQVKHHFLSKPSPIPFPTQVRCHDCALHSTSDVSYHCTFV